MQHLFFRPSRFLLGAGRLLLRPDGLLFRSGRLTLRSTQRLGGIPVGPHPGLTQPADRESDYPEQSNAEAADRVNQGE
jgi:hypothetical protein